VRLGSLKSWLESLNLETGVFELKESEVFGKIKKSDRRDSNQSAMSLQLVGSRVLES
jgi:hypothetical protein